MTHLWYDFMYVLGINDPTSRWYYFWSAFGSGPLAWCVLPATYYWHHICHEGGCFRMGHPVDGIVHCKHHVLRGI